MENLIRTLTDYYNRTDFRKFQNNFSKEVYDTLATSYSNAYNEVKTVTEMCNSIDGKSFEKLKFYTKKIHGSRSFVEFNNQDKPVTTELADMVIISVVTKSSEIIFEKTAFVQNKKEDEPGSWKIDQDQLYLLHNFPTFKGQRGIFKKNFSDEVAFLNHSETLGNYGLFQQPGEMLLANASTIFKLQQNSKISLSDFRKHGENNLRQGHGFPFSFMDHPFMDEMLYRMFKHFPKYGFPFLDLPFLNNKTVSHNIYEFIRNWTLFNIGDLVSVNGTIIDKDLSSFSRVLLRETGLTNVINLHIDAPDFDNNLIVFVAHLALDEEK